MNFAIGSATLHATDSEAEVTIQSGSLLPPLPPAPAPTAGMIRRQRSLNLPTSLGISLILHVVAVTAMAVRFSSPQPTDTPPPAAMIVELAAMPSAPVTDTSDLPPGPEQVEARDQPVEPHETDFDPPPQANLAVKPNFILPAKESPQPPAPEVVAVAAKQTTAPPAAQQPSTETRKAAPTEGNNMAPPSDAEQAWEGSLLARLERNKRYPPAARSAGQEDTVFVRLVIDRAGQLIDARLKRSSGFDLLDQETLALAKRASPFPPPPPQLAGAQIVRVVPIEFYIKRRR